MALHFVKVIESQCKTRWKKNFAAGLFISFINNSLLLLFPKPEKSSFLANDSNRFEVSYLQPLTLFLPLSMNALALTAQTMTFSIKDFFSKCDQMRRKLRIWSHLLKKFLMKFLIFYAVIIYYLSSCCVRDVPLTWKFANFFHELLPSFPYFLLSLCVNTSLMFVR